MAGCCNNVQGINTVLNSNCGCGSNSSVPIIIAAIIALILVNVLDRNSVSCLGDFLQAVGELMTLSSDDGCFGNLLNTNSCSYY